MNTQARIGLIIPSGNRLTEPQFNQYAPPGTGIYVTRLRMTGQGNSFRSRSSIT